MTDYILVWILLAFIAGMILGALLTRPVITR